MRTGVFKKVSVPRQEYARLKRLDRRFGDFLSYAADALDVAQARADARAGRVVSQEALFRRLGI